VTGEFAYDKARPRMTGCMLTCGNICVFSNPRRRHGLCISPSVQEHAPRMCSGTKQHIRAALQVQLPYGQRGPLHTHPTGLSVWYTTTAHPGMGWQPPFVNTCLHTPNRLANMMRCAMLNHAAQLTHRLSLANLKLMNKWMFSIKSQSCHTELLSSS
jgi:hypothetical protein